VSEHVPKGSIHELELVQIDGKGDHFYVYWRKLPIGSLRRFVRMPTPPRHANDETRRRLREEFRLRRGKWYDPHGRLREPVDSKEEGARRLLDRFLANPRDTPLVRAAIRGDVAEVERLMAELGRPGTTEDGRTR
jgi:hypothetical protein